MARTTKIFVLCVVILLGAALVKYGTSVRSQRALARQQHEEAMKLAQLKADLMKAASGSSGQTAGSGRTSQRNTGSTAKPRPT